MRNMSLLLAVHVLHLWSYFAFRARVRRTEWRFLSDSQHRSRWEPSTARTAHPEPRQSESSSSSDLSTPSDRWCPAIWWTVPRSEQTKKRPTSLISLNLRYQKFIIRITNTARRNAVTLLFFLKKFILLMSGPVQRSFNKITIHLISVFPSILPVTGVKNTQFVGKNKTSFISNSETFLTWPSFLSAPPFHGTWDLSRLRFDL